MKLRFNTGGRIRAALRVIIPPSFRHRLTNWKIRAVTFFSRVRNGLLHGSMDYFDEVLIETSTACNRKCSYCPNSIYDRGDIKNNKLMDEKLYKHIIDDLALINFKGLIKPFNFNEPLLDKRLPRLIAYTRKKLPKSNIWIATNGDFLTFETYQTLVNAGVSHINITTHMKTMPKHISDLFEKLKALHDKTKVQYITITPTSFVNRGGLVNIKRTSVIPRCVSAPVGMCINYKGDVFLCCNDYFCKYTFGNVSKSRIIDIWRSPRYVKIRKELNKGIYEYPLCKECMK